MREDKGNNKGNQPKCGIATPQHLASATPWPPGLISTGHFVRLILMRNHSLTTLTTVRSWLNRQLPVQHFLVQSTLSSYNQAVSDQNMHIENGRIHASEEDMQFFY